MKYRPDYGIWVLGFMVTIVLGVLMDDALGLQEKEDQERYPGVWVSEPQVKMDEPAKQMRDFGKDKTYRTKDGVLMKVTFGTEAE